MVFAFTFEKLTGNSKPKAKTLRSTPIYKAKLDKSHFSLEPEQIALFEAHQAESKSRNRAAQLETQQLVRADSKGG
jgi:hypothetical protein